MRVFLTALLVVMTVQPAAAATWQPVERNFVRIPIPALADLNASRFGSRSWRVRFKGDSLEVTGATSSAPALPFSPQVDTATMGYYGSQPTQALHFKNAWFLSYYHGEFGGALWQFSADGSVGRMLLGGPTYDLLPFGNEVLVATGSAAPWFLKPLLIHRFALRAGFWQEVGHTDFDRDITTLTNLGGRLYGIDSTAYFIATLSRLDLSGSLYPLWAFDGHLDVTSLAESRHRDYALGARGYIVRLHAGVNGLSATWYAPRDCTHYTPSKNDSGALDARCIGAAATKPFERLRSAPASYAWTSEDGNWMLPFGGRRLLHFVGHDWIEDGDSPLGSRELPRQILTAGNDLVILSTGALWLRQAGKWSRVVSADGTCQRVAITGTIAWCLTFESDRSVLTATNFNGTSIATYTIHAQSEVLSAGLGDDVWFSLKNMPFVGHMMANGNTEQKQLQSSILSLSRSANGVWFSETDHVHYGFIDASGTVHELAWLDPGVLSITGAHWNAWLEELFQDRRVMIRKVNTAGSKGGGAYAADVRSILVAPDGTLWAQSRLWPTILRITESGEVTRYRLPCLDQHLVFLHGPNNGLWFLSKERHCNGYIDAADIHVRDLPMMQHVDYK